MYIDPFVYELHSAEFPELWREFLTEYETSQDVPIRILSLRGRAAPLEISWTDEHVADIDHDVEVAESVGITYLDWGTYGTRPRMRARGLPQFLLTEPHDDVEFQTLGSLITPREMPAWARVFSWQFPVTERTFVAETRPNTVLYRAPLMLIAGATMGHPEWFDLEKLFLAPLEQAFDTEGFSVALEQAQAQTLEAYIQVTSGRTNGEVERLRNDIANYAENMTEYQRRASESQSQLVAKQNLLDAALSLGDTTNTEEARRAEFERVLENDCITAINMIDNNTVLQIMTNDLTMTDPQTDRSAIVGRFQITVDLATGSDHPYINVTNLTNPKGRFDHPHVNGHELCMGQYSSTMTQLLTTSKYGAAINLLMEILQTVTVEDDWGRHAAWWFEDDENNQPPSDAAPLE